MYASDAGTGSVKAQRVVDDALATTGFLVSERRSDTAAFIVNELQRASMLLTDEATAELEALRHVVETMKAVSTALRTRYSDNSDAAYFMRQIDAALAATDANSPAEDGSPERQPLDIEHLSWNDIWSGPLILGKPGNGRGCFPKLPLPGDIHDQLEFPHAAIDKEQLAEALMGHTFNAFGECTCSHRTPDFKAADRMRIHEERHVVDVILKALRGEGK